MESAAKQGHAPAQRLLSFYLKKGFGTDENLDKSTEWLFKSANQHHPLDAEFAKTAERTPEGRIVDVFGGAWVAVHKPSYRLRTALKTLGRFSDRRVNRR